MIPAPHDMRTPRCRARGSRSLAHARSDAAGLLVNQRTGAPRVEQIGGHIAAEQPLVPFAMVGCVELPIAEQDPIAVVGERTREVQREITSRAAASPNRIDG